MAETAEAVVLVERVFAMVPVTVVDDGIDEEDCESVTVGKLDVEVMIAVDVEEIVVLEEMELPEEVVVIDEVVALEEMEALEEVVVLDEVVELAEAVVLEEAEVLEGIVLVAEPPPSTGTTTALTTWSRAPAEAVELDVDVVGTLLAVELEEDVVGTLVAVELEDDVAGTLMLVDEDVTVAEVTGAEEV